MQVYVQKSTMTTRPRRPSVASGGELSHSVAPSRDGILPSAMRRPGAQPGPRIAPLIVASRDRFVSMTRSSIPVMGGGLTGTPLASAGTVAGRGFAMGNSRLDAAGGPLRCETGSAVNPWVTPSERGSCRAREEPSGGGDQASTAPWRAVAGGRRIATQDEPRPRTKGFLDALRISHLPRYLTPVVAGHPSRAWTRGVTRWTGCR